MSIIIKNKHYKLEMSDINGQILNYGTDKQSFVSNEPKPLLEVKLLDKNGNGLYYNSNNAEFNYTETENGYTFCFANLAENLNGKVYLEYNSSAFVSWSCEIENNTGNIIEWVGLPGLLTNDKLVGEGGSSLLFWPFGEGCIIDNTIWRETTSEWLGYKEITGQSAGYNGQYPGPVCMQFMAFYNENGGLYIGCEDEFSHLKVFEYHAEGNGVCLEMRVFADGATAHYKMPFKIKTGTFNGDWQDACEIYRAWLETTTNILPPKIENNPNLPDWYKNSPVVALYPIRGTKDSGDMTPNMYYPYKNVLPFVDNFNNEFKCPVMALPMHWEGTAPWAPPYVWPPYGGKEQFVDFANALHEKGNLLGVYCSGIGWTEYSYNDEIDISDKYDEEFICRMPDGSIKYSILIGPPIRKGYDMCASHEKVPYIVKGEVEALADAGCDYTQYFDQNLGGFGTLCYGREHNHPPAPGKWISDSMVKIFKTACENVDSKKMLIGCEGASSEAFMKYLPLNDLRNNITFFMGYPVSAYAYLYHEYINNFMGNQNTIDRIMDLPKNPDNLLFRTAYSFASGDMLSVCLAKEGKISWGWDVDWDISEYPNQDNIKTLIANLNPWRTGFASKYLHTGKMIKAENVNGVGTYSITCYHNRTLNFADVFISAFEASDGEKAMVITNYLGNSKKVSFEGEHKVWYNCENENDFTVCTDYEIPPYSAVVVKM